MVLKSYVFGRTSKWRRKTLVMPDRLIVCGWKQCIDIFGY